MYQVVEINDMQCRRSVMSDFRIIFRNKSKYFNESQNTFL